MKTILPAILLIGIVEISLAGVDINSELVKGISTDLGKNYEPLNRQIYRWETVNGKEVEIVDTVNNGIIFKFIPESTAKKIFKKYQPRALGIGRYIFLSNLEFDRNMEQFYDVIVVNERDKYEIVRRFNTSGPNYDVTNKMVIDKLRKWDVAFNLNIAVIDEDRIEAYIQTVPKNLKSVCKEIYDFCPDVIEQGYSSMPEMTRDYKTNRYFWLWWD